MIDLQLPRPLLDPSKWPAGEAMLSIFSLQNGGPFTARVAKCFAAPADFWSKQVQPSFAAILMQTSALQDAEIVSRSPLSDFEMGEWRKHGVSSFRVDRDLKVPSVSDWSREVFPRSLREAGEVVWLRELREYEAQLGDQTGSLDSLRFWPAFLRSRKLSFSSTAAAEWARASALFSPQSDDRGNGSLADLNPTLQVVTDAAIPRAFWRLSGVLHEADLRWQEAAVIDELRETPRSHRTALVDALSSRPYNLASDTTFEAVIEEMIARGLILLRA